MPNIQIRSKELENIWFEQDGITEPTTIISTQDLSVILARRVILAPGEIIWPTHSSDLCACDFF